MYSALSRHSHASLNQIQQGLILTWHASWRFSFPGGLLLLATAPIFGHHSVSAEFDVNRQITYAGVVTRVEWSNPHIYFYVDVKDANEKVTNWAFEGAGPNTLARLGWLRDSLKVGDRVTVIAFPARDGLRWLRRGKLGLRTDKGTGRDATGTKARRNVENGWPKNAERK